MSFALPLLFAIAGLVSMVAIWQAVASNWTAIADLRRQVARPEHGAEIVVNYRDSTADFEAVSLVRRPRQLRVPAPKPVTHRLHQFTRVSSAA